MVEKEWQACWARALAKAAALSVLKKRFNVAWCTGRLKRPAVHQFGVLPVESSCRRVIRVISPGQLKRTGIEDGAAPRLV